MDIANIDLSNPEIVKAIKEQAKKLGLIIPKEKKERESKGNIYSLDKFDKWNRFTGISIVMTLNGQKKVTTFPQGNCPKKELQGMVDLEIIRLKKKFGI